MLLFSCIVFTELNFTVAFLLIRKNWDDGFAGEVGGWGIFKNEGGGDPSNGGMILKWGVNTPLRTMNLFWIIAFLIALYKRRFCAAGKSSVFVKLEIGGKKTKIFQ